MLEIIKGFDDKQKASNNNKMTWNSKRQNPTRMRRRRIFEEQEEEGHEVALRPAWTGRSHYAPPAKRRQASTSMMMSTNPLSLRSMLAVAPLLLFSWPANNHGGTVVLAQSLNRTSDAPSLVPTSYPFMLASKPPSDGPSMIPSSEPSSAINAGSTQAPSLTMTVTMPPSDVPTNEPSMAVTDYPSMVISSIMPSLSPTGIPSFTPDTKGIPVQGDVALILDSVASVMPNQTFAVYEQQLQSFFGNALQWKEVTAELLSQTLYMASRRYQRRFLRFLPKDSELDQQQLYQHRRMQQSLAPLETVVLVSGSNTESLTESQVVSLLLAAVNGNASGLIDLLHASGDAFFDNVNQITGLSLSQVTAIPTPAPVATPTVNPPNSAQPPSSGGDDGSSGLSSGIIIGIAVAGAVVVLGCVGFVAYQQSRKSGNGPDRSSTGGGGAGSGTSGGGMYGNAGAIPVGSGDSSAQSPINQAGSAELAPIKKSATSSGGPPPGLSVTSSTVGPGAVSSIAASKGSSTQQMTSPSTSDFIAANASFGRRDQGSFNASGSDSVAGDTATYMGAPNALDPNADFEADSMSYAYSLDAGNMDVQSMGGTATGSNLQAASVGGDEVSDSYVSQKPAMVTRQVMAPSGKLGIVIDTTIEGPVVHKVNPNSPLEGSIFPGDIIVAIDDVDTRAMSASAITALMVKTANQRRKLTVLSEDVQ